MIRQDNYRPPLSEQNIRDSTPFRWIYERWENQREPDPT
jgi:hypothetical protein